MLSGSSAGDVSDAMRSVAIPGKKKTLRLRTLKDMERFARGVAATLRGGEVIALSGPLGAGKTTFVQFLGSALGVKHRITSPTFTLMRLYDIPPAKSQTSCLTTLVHIDAYRLRSAQALVAIGALDYIGEPQTVTVIEWAEKVKSALPGKTQWCIFQGDQ